MSDVKCSKCENSKVVKAGNPRNKQRYKCKTCGSRFIVTDSKVTSESRIGGRGTITLKKLYDDIAPIGCTRYYTDGHAPYKNVLPAKKHQAGRGLTNMAEGINSAVRHYLARFHRRSKCYTKSTAMAEASVRLLIYRLNQKQADMAA